MTCAQAAAARGKKVKSKKAAIKYADQDDEDRRLVMAILGSAGSSLSGLGPKSQQASGLTHSCVVTATVTGQVMFRVRVEVIRS